MENPVDSVENQLLSRDISRYFRHRRGVENSVDIGDNWVVIHSLEVVMSQRGNGGDRGKTVAQVGICRLFGEVGWGSDGPGSDKLCEKPPNAAALLPFTPDVSISRNGKYCG